ncbi:uncharacterized protein cubi_01369 [Cryptosporidium ubiquitum]|uniref:Uncharacterized protein n=1 Tax=Cryptosporidium ubiquitum TaxID=857276 RepID=A0A1J4MG89_9CRYT|nr:uncharacterized protein cubi_01369 [Cryptosporidium ubiquitum]OII72036.1 hypothetical protein cubi_01369 [Cryptosporidium ubiquitum]
MSISPQINESIREIVLLTQEITNIYEHLSDEKSFLSHIKNEISELESYIKSTYDKLQILINDIKSIEGSYLKELETGENICRNNSTEIYNFSEDNKHNALISLKCEEIERELSNIHNRYALLLDKKRNLLKSMRDSEDVLHAKKKMYQSISMISWSLISESFIQGHFIPVNSPTKTETFQLQINENSKL